MINVTSEKLTDIECSLRSEFGDATHQTPDDPTIIMTGKILPSTLMDAIRGGIKALDIIGVKSDDQKAEVACVMLYMMALGIRTGIALAESEQLNSMVGGE